MLQQLQNLASDDITQRPPHPHIQLLNFVNKIFVILRLIMKFMKKLCHENLELYGIYEQIDFLISSEGLQQLDQLERLVLQW